MVAIFSVKVVVYEWSLTTLTSVIVHDSPPYVIVTLTDIQLRLPSGSGCEFLKYHTKFITEYPTLNLTDLLGP